MKKFLTIAFTLFFAPTVFAGNLAFQSGRIYRAKYTPESGRAILAMTGSPEHVIITVGMDYCETENTDCGGMRGKKGDIHGVVYRLLNKSTNEDQIKYEAVPLPFTETARKLDEYKREEKQGKSKITLEVDLSPSNAPSGYGGAGKDSFVAKSIIMTVTEDGEIRKYDLQVTGFTPYWPLNLRAWPTN